MRYRSEERRMRLLEHAWPQPDVFKMVVLAMIRKWLASPYPLDDFKSLVEHFADLLWCKAKALPFGAPGAFAHPYIEPPMRQVVQHGQLFGKLYWMMKGKDINHIAQAYA